MSGPFIFIATNRLKEGKLEEERERVSGLVDFIQENEPRLLAFNEYANEEGTTLVSSRFVVSGKGTRTPSGPDTCASTKAGVDQLVISDVLFANLGSRRQPGRR